MAIWPIPSWHSALVPAMHKNPVPEKPAFVLSWRERRLKREVSMLGMSIWKIAIIGGIVMVMFGRGKVSELMGDVAKGIKSFKRGMAEDDDAPTVIEQKPVVTVAANPVEDVSRS